MSQVPEWMFISWIPQILSRFSFAAPCFLDQLVVRLARVYSSAMLFPFQLAHSQYKAKFRRNSAPASRPVVDLILELLKNPLAEQLIASIECLSLPEQVLSSHLEPLFVQLRDNEPSEIDAFHDDLTQTMRMVYENPMRGQIIDRIREFEAPLEELLQIDGKW